MGDMKHEDSEHLSRQQVAERLTDIAYALTVGSKVRIGNDQEVDLAVAGRVTLVRDSTSQDGRTELGIRLSWLDGS